jgi:hypothetical protein
MLGGRWTERQRCSMKKRAWGDIEEACRVGRPTWRRDERRAGGGNWGWRRQRRGSKSSWRSLPCRGIWCVEWNRSGAGVGLPDWPADVQPPRARRLEQSRFGEMRFRLHATTRAQDVARNHRPDPDGIGNLGSRSLSSEITSLGLSLHCPLIARKATA